MTFTQVKKFIDAKHNGTWFKMEIESEVPSKGDSKVVKHTTMVVRKGIDYKRTQQFKNKHGAKETSNSSALPWGKWVEGCEGLFIEHTAKDKSFNQYLRVYTSPNKAKSKYFYRNEEATKEYLIENDIVVPSKVNSSCNNGVMNIKLSSIYRIY